MQAAAAAPAAEWQQPRSRGNAAAPQEPLDIRQSTDRQEARPAHPGWWERMDGGAGKPQGLPAHLPRLLQFVYSVIWLAHWSRKPLVGTSRAAPTAAGLCQAPTTGSACKEGIR